MWAVVKNYLVGLALWCVFCASISTGAPARDLLTISADKNTFLAYVRFLDGRDPVRVSNFSSKRVTRGVVDLVFLQKALKLGGNTRKIHFILMPSYPRSVYALRNGDYVVSAEAIWSSDIEESTGELMAVSPLVEDGEYYAGLYTIASNSAVTEIKTPADVERFSIVSNRSWKTDWTTLQSINFSDIQSAATFEVMLGMVTRGRVDLLLIPFSNEADLSYIFAGTKFIPVPNYKVRLRGSRHFAVSAKHPLGASVYAELEKGIQLLRKDGVIKEGYSQAGFFNEQTKDWQVVN